MHTVSSTPQWSCSVRHTHTHAPHTTKYGVLVLCTGTGTPSSQRVYSSSRKLKESRIGCTVLAQYLVLCVAVIRTHEDHESCRIERQMDSTPKYSSIRNLSSPMHMVQDIATSTSQQLQNPCRHKTPTQHSLVASIDDDACCCCCRRFRRICSWVRPCRSKCSTRDYLVWEKSVHHRKLEVESNHQS